MFCSSCGAEIPEGSVFCVNCGARLDVPAPASQPPQNQQSDDRALYSQPYNQPPYGQSPYGQPPKKGRPPKWMLIAGGAVLLLAIAAVLVFVVFGVGGGGWPLSGNTMQTRFVNDGFRVFSGAFADLGNKDMARLLTEPFDVEMKVNVDTGSIPVEATIAAAYDKELLGLNAEALGQDVKLQLDEDTLYYSIYGSVGGYRFDTDTDLSKPMALKDRFAALVESLQEGSSDADTLLVAEAMVNSISEKCFDRGANETTLTMTPDDIIDMLKSLKEKTKEDKELRNQLGKMDLDIDEAIEGMEQTKEYSDFDLMITISYDGGTPTDLEIDFDDGTEYGTVNVKFGYEKTGDGKDINLNIDASGSQVDASLSVVKNGKDVEYDGELKVSYGGASDETYAIEGGESWDGEDVEGSVTVTDNDGAQYGIDYSGTLVFGMPEENIEDDSRFKIDKSDADVQDIEDALGYSMMGYYGLDTAAFNIDEAEPALTASAAPAESELASVGPESETMVLGVVLPALDTNYYDTLLENIISEASYYGWEVRTYASDNAGGADAALETLVADGADAAIIDPTGLAEDAIKDLTDLCSEAGIVCAVLLDEGETADGGTAAVRCDLTYAGADMAYLCDYGDVFVIGGSENSAATHNLEQGLLYDSDYGIDDYADIDLKGIAYTEGTYSVADIVSAALDEYPDINTFMCTDPNLARELLDALESMNYTGNLICYTYETTMDEMDAYVEDTYVTYEYFPVTDIAYYCVTAIADQIEYGMSPQVYTVLSYSY